MAAIDRRAPLSFPKCTFQFSAVHPEGVSASRFPGGGGGAM